MHHLTPTSKHLYKYVLILVDDFSGFVQLVPTTSPDHCKVPHSVMYCYKRFGVPKTLVSDQGPHFIHKTLKESTGFCPRDFILHGLNSMG